MPKIICILLVLVLSPSYLLAGGDKNKHCKSVRDISETRRSGEENAAISVASSKERRKAKKTERYGVYINEEELGGAEASLDSPASVATRISTPLLAKKSGLTGYVINGVSELHVFSLEGAKNAKERLTQDEKDQITKLSVQLFEYKPTGILYSSNPLPELIYSLKNLVTLDARGCFWVTGATLGHCVIFNRQLRDVFVLISSEIRKRDIEAIASRKQLISQEHPEGTTEKLNIHTSDPTLLVIEGENALVDQFINVIPPELM